MPDRDSTTIQSAPTPDHAAGSSTVTSAGGREEPPPSPDSRHGGPIIPPPQPARAGEPPGTSAPTGWQVEQGRVFPVPRELATALLRLRSVNGSFWKHALRRFQRRRRKALRAAAKAADRRENWPEAVRLWREVLDAFGKRAGPDVYVRLSRAHRRLGDLDAARSLVATGSEKFPRDSSLTVEIAEIATAACDWTEAARRWQAAAEAVGSDLSRSGADGISVTAATIAKAGRIEEALSFLRDIRKSVGDRKAFLAVEGIAWLRAGRWEEARRHWAAYAGRALADPEFERQPDPNFTLRNVQAGRFETAPRHSASGKRTGRFDRICVYTALIGDVDELSTPVFKTPDIDLICFSDRPRKVEGWRIRIVEISPDHPALRNRMIKILPYEYLPEYDYSLYVDANVVLLGDLRSLIDVWLRDRPFVAWRHPDRSDVYAECEAILSSHRDDPGSTIDEYECFREAGLPEHTGLIEASCLWRDHRDARVRELMERWREHLVRFGRRDQPGLGYWMWKTGIRPLVLPDELGTSRNNEFFAKKPHRMSVLEVERNRSNSVLRSGGAGDASVPGVAGRAVGIPTGRRTRRLIWVYRESARQVASTVMRGFQLSRMAGELLGDDVVTDCVNEKAIASLPPSTLILTKGFLKGASADDLEAMKKAGHMICSDIVDELLRDELAELIDLHIASSIAQFVEYTWKFRDKPVQLITHHPDPRLAGLRAPTDTLRIGYFGEPANVKYRRELRGSVDFVRTPTNRTATRWIRRLERYNVHYAVRDRRRFDGVKPFLKGFTAASCGANILVPAAESDARYYLGSAYPYLLKDDSLETVLGMIEFVKDSFGGPEWREGLEIMASVRERCSPSHIGKELRQLLAICS